MLSEAAGHTPVVGAVTHELWDGPDPGVAEHLPVPRFAICARCETKAGLRIVANERNQFVAKGEEVPGRHPSALDIVGHDHRHTSAARVDEHDGHPGGHQTSQAASWRLQ